MTGQAQVQVVQQQQVRTIFDPEVVERYNQIVPGSAERIFKILENNNETEREMRALPFKEAQRRDWMGYSITVFVLAATIVFAFMNQPWLYGPSLLTFLGIVIKSFFPVRK